MDVRTTLEKSGISIKLDAVLFSPLLDDTVDDVFHLAGRITWTRACTK